MSDASTVGDLEVVRHAQARRAKLSVDPVSGRVRLTLPRCAALGPALAWAQEKSGWIARQRERLPVPRPFVPNAIVPFGDQSLTIDWDASRPRTVRQADDRLVCGGPLEGLSRRVETWLKREALRVLAAETAEIAAVAGVTVTAVTIGDPRGRWGSCASHGAIRYSWRLILAPEMVRRATVAHEVAHRVHMNHGPDFHALAADLSGGTDRKSGRWLRAHGASLHWIGREAA